jgi:hypothetical protein
MPLANFYHNRIFWFDPKGTNSEGRLNYFLTGIVSACSLSKKCVKGTGFAKYITDVPPFHVTRDVLNEKPLPMTLSSLLRLPEPACTGKLWFGASMTIAQNSKSTPLLRRLFVAKDLLKQTV